MDKKTELRTKYLIQSAIQDSLISKKLFILTMKGYRCDRKLPREDRITLAICGKLSDCLEINNIPQYYMKDYKGTTRYIDFVQFEKNSQIYSDSEIDWGLEAKHYSPHQDMNNDDKYLQNSLAGVTSDIQKLKDCEIKNRFLLLIQSQIINIDYGKENLQDVISAFPFIKYLGDDKAKIKANIDNARLTKRISKLENEIRKMDSDLINDRGDFQLLLNTAKIDVRINYILFKD